MSKLCVLQLTPEEIGFTVFDERNPAIWAELTRDHFFTEYHLVGLSPEENRIYLEFDALMLSKTLTSLKQGATSVKIKLTNKQQPCLTLEIELPSVTNDSWQCVHDVPIRMVPRKEWRSYEPPEIPNFDRYRQNDLDDFLCFIFSKYFIIELFSKYFGNDQAEDYLSRHLLELTKLAETSSLISLDLPQLKHMRNVVEKMKNLSPQLSIFASNDGMLILKIGTDSAYVSTHFPGLNVYQENVTQEERVSATVDIRKFGIFLAWESVHPDQVKCSILHDRMIYLHLNLDDNFKINYFLPATDI